jgi:hypothetical protein
MTYGVAAAQQHHLHGIGLVSLYCLAIGLVLMVTASVSLAARQWRGTDAQPGSIRGRERVAKPQLRLGGVLTTVGAVGLLVWWVALR